MIDFLEIWQYPFMQRALVAGIFIAVLLAVLGVFVMMRKMAFFGDGIAHASLAGIAIGLLAGFEPLPIAILFAVGIALAMYFLEKKSSLGSDMVIGIFFTTSLAMGVILLSLDKAYRPDLMSFLFGNILAVSQGEAVLTVVCVLGLLLGLIALWRKMTLLVFDPEQAVLQGVKETWMNIFLYVSLAIAVVLGAKLVGVILVSALLVIPVATVKMAAKNYAQMVWWSILLSAFALVLGLFSSYWFDLPAGAMIVVVSFFIFILAFLVRTVRKD